MTLVGPNLTIAYQIPNHQGPERPRTSGHWTQIILGYPLEGFPMNLSPLLSRFAPALGVVLLSIAPAQAQVSLVLKHPENQATQTETEVKLQQTMTIMGQEIQTSSDQTILTRQANGQRRADGNLPVEATIEAVKGTAIIQGMTISFDSEKPDAEADPRFKPITDSMKMIVGISYTLVFDQTGKVVAVEGTEKALEKASQTSPELAEAAKARFSADKIKQTANDQFGRFPEAPVRPGETWTRKEVQELGMGQTFTYEKTYEYVGPVEKDGKTLDKINVKVSSLHYSQDPNAGGPAKVTKNDLKIDSSEGTLLFDRNEGRVVEGTEKQHITGSLTLEVMGQSIDAGLDLTIEEHSNIKPVK